VGAHAASPAALLAARGECTCAGATLLATFLSELRVLAPLVLCVRALDRPFRSRRPDFKTRRGPALLRVEPSPQRGKKKKFASVICRRHIEVQRPDSVVKKRLLDRPLVGWTRVAVRAASEGRGWGQEGGGKRRAGAGITGVIICPRGSDISRRRAS
jgi:hypothetical protein